MGKGCIFALNLKLNKMKKLNALSKEFHENAKAKGFWDEKREIGTLLMLVVSELSEALESDRRKRYANIEAFEDKLKNSRIIQKDPTYDGAVSYEDAWSAHFERHIKDSFEDEIADTFIRLLDLCGAGKIDIEKHIKLKVQYNKMRAHKHGKAY